MIAAAIRTARVTDVGALSAIENAVFPTDRISTTSFLRLIRSGSAAVAVSDKGGDLMGYFVLLFRAGSSKARLYSIAAAPGQSGTGIGKALLQAAEGEAMQRGTAALRLEVRADNLRAIRLYERNGYRPFGRIEDYYDDGEAALRFEKALTQAVAPSCPPVAPRSTVALAGAIAIAGRRGAAAVATGRRRRR